MAGARPSHGVAACAYLELVAASFTKNSASGDAYVATLINERDRALADAAALRAGLNKSKAQRLAEEAEAREREELKVAHLRMLLERRLMRLEFAQAESVLQREAGYGSVGARVFSLVYAQDLRPAH